MGVRKQSEQCSSGAGSRRRYLWKSVVLTLQWNFSIWWFVSTKIQQPRNTDPTRWVTLYTPLGPCIHDSVAIGSLVDLGQDLHGYIQYTIYCKWNVRLLNACGLRWILNCDFDTGLCTKRCSKKFLKFEEFPARVIACWGFCEDFDVCVAILPCDC